MTTMKKLARLLSLVLCVALCLSLAACGGGSSGDETTTAAADTSSATTAVADANVAGGDYKVFKYGTDANSTTFDPASDLQTNSGSILVQSVGETLWKVDVDGNMTYKLAESVDYTADALTITLKQGVKFSNGDELTAADVLFTFEHVASQPRTMSMYACLDLENATMPSDYELVIPMNYYDAGIIDLLGNANSMILDANVAGGDDYDFSWLIGTGPYMLQGDGVTDKSGWTESVSYTLVRNPYYWGTEPYYDELDIYFYSQESTRYADFQAGNLDAIYLTEATYINNLAGGAVPGSSLIQVEENAVYGFEMAVEDGTTQAMSDINIRKAFAHALDIETMVNTLGEGVYRVATSLVGEGCWAYEDLGVYEYDPELAAQYLAEAGYSVDNPLTIHVYAESTSWYSALFEAAQEYEAQIGINLDLSGVADFATILPVLISGGHDMTMGSASNGSGNDPENLLQQFGPLSDNGLIRVVDDDLVALYNDASAGNGDRTTLYQQFMEGIYENYLFVPVCVGTKNYGVNDAHASFASAIDASNQLDPTLLTD
jgi:ABC-type transport system substrate-binding protein